MTFFEELELRDIREEDLDLILQMRNQEHIRKVMFDSDIISFTKHSEWLRSLKKSETDIAKIFYNNGKPYGMLNVNKIDNRHRTCDWGFYIGDLSAPRGMGTLLGFTALNFIFNKLYMKKVCAQVIENNNISINFHEKFGFIQEGILRKQIFKEDSYKDIYLYGIFAEEWQERSVSLCKEIKTKYSISFEQKF